MAVYIYHEFDIHTIHSITSFILKKKKKLNSFFTPKLNYNSIALPPSCFRIFL